MDAASTSDSSDPIVWNAAGQLLVDPELRYSLIVLNQPIRDPPLFRELWRSATTKIAADGGANHIYELSKQTPPGPEGVEPAQSEQFKDLDAIIGDLDSLADEARRYFSRSRVIRDDDQYSTDFAKAVRLARREAPGRDVVCMGGLGGRVDQGLSQLHHLYLFQKSPTYADGRMYLVSGDSLSFLLKGGGRPHHIRVREREPRHLVPSHRLAGEPFGKHVGIIPVGEPAVISTRGLEWDVRDWPTAFGGQMSTSNHVLPETEVVEVRTDKDVLFTIALRKVPST
ncbi:thiamine pyrophosphokinase [Xylaria palmicola]|nr:thiamine pyrophosphokinase [Xylaria palmicola]